MFLVYAFNNVLEDFEVVGAFSNKEEADALCATLPAKSKAVLEQSWRDAVDQATRVRLGPIAEALKALGIKC